MLQNMLLVGAGGFIGSALRFGSGQLLLKMFDSIQPIGTFFVNIIGSFLIGLVLGIFEKGDLMSASWKMFLAVGLCGGFTTFSAFAFENLHLLQTQHYLMSLIYISSSIVFGLVAVYFGFWLAK